MEITDEICERARHARDPRFDGCFFIGVVTTSVFCRPTCPVQPPRGDRVRFFPTAAAAVAAGFRPCLRCLPELAPGTRTAASASDRVERALALIADGFLDGRRHDDLAAAVGVSARQLARLFRRHVGATPGQVAHTRRLLFAKQLLDDSDLSLTEVAFAAGFGSLRRFNTVIRETWQRPPSMLRRRGASTAVAGAPIRLHLAYRPPFDWPALIDFHRRRALPGVECVHDGRYRRTVTTAGGSGWIEVGPAAHALELSVSVPDVSGLAVLVARVRRMFDLDAEPSAIAAVLGADPLLAPVVEECPGLRVPCAWDTFEVAVRAILGQQVSVEAARTLAARIVEAYGEPIDTPPDAGPDRLFPAPERLAEAPLERLGVIGARARAIRHLAAGLASGALELDAPGLAGRLVALPGIGDWTAQYVAMRSGRDPDAFPAADLGLRRGAEEGEPVTAAQLRRRAEAWRPWRAYAAVCLWRRHAALGREHIDAKEVEHAVHVSGQPHR
ncbi:AlkA N-terminal domain-containing protein [Arhodomonas sp. AD133]|uniref:DNA-3-methyladenine glycosylase 2 family protein n=1 Tax=Arhodomonas sp. AD133 TaxID=3415009 RepID=UPI003EBC8B52